VGGGWLWGWGEGGGGGGRMGGKQVVDACKVDEVRVGGGVVPESSA
jgi:hypothetical protein